MRSNLSRAKVEPSDGARKLQERLHQLLSRLSATIEVVKTWRESDGDDIAIHRTTTTRLMGSVMEVLEALKRVEGVVKADQELRKALQNCPVALDLLVLLDHGGGLNPDCFSRGLLKEALGQLAGLKRRKLALNMLGAAVQKGLNKRIEEANRAKMTRKGSSSKTSKRSRVESTAAESAQQIDSIAETQEGTKPDSDAGAGEDTSTDGHKAKRARTGA